MLYKFPKFISKKECEDWIKWIPKSKTYDIRSFDNRTFDVFDFDLIEKIQKHLYDNIGVITECYSAEAQIWPAGCFSNLHIHNKGMRLMGDYNSLIYLNNNFWGGEFITKNEKIKPSPGLLTFFDGSKVYHGVNKVRFNHRYTLIFWWKNTRFI